MRRNVIAGIVLSSVLLISTSGVSTAASIGTMKLDTDALSFSQMPSGWRVGNDAGDVGVGCLAYLIEPSGVQQTAEAEVYYVGDPGLPVFDEKLATYSNVTTAYKKITKKIASCRTINGEQKGYPVTGSVRSMKFTRYGNASVSYAMRLTSVHLTVSYDYVIVRKGNVIAAFLEGNIPSVSTSQFRGFIVKALAKIH